MDYTWPGNMRGLENTMKRFVILVPRKLIYEEDLPEVMLKSGEKIGSRSMSTRTLKERIEDLEKGAIQEALQSCIQNKRQAAKLLGLSRQGLLDKMKRYGIKPDESS
jgi:Nif-specific regulatory protein